MLNHQALLILGDQSKITASKAQQAIRLFADYDMTIPRSLVPEELDKRFGLSAGTAKKLLATLVELGVLESLSQGRLSAGGHACWVLAAGMGWTPRSLMEQWERLEMVGERAGVARIAVGHHHSAVTR